MRFRLPRSFPAAALHRRGTRDRGGDEALRTGRADQGSAMYVTGTADPRWADALDQFRARPLDGAALQVVKPWRRDRPLLSGPPGPRPRLDATMSEPPDAPRLAETFAEVEDALLSRWPETRLEPSPGPDPRPSPSCSATRSAPTRSIHLTGTNGKTSHRADDRHPAARARPAHRPVHQPARRADDRADLASTASR